MSVTTEQAEAELASMKLVFARYMDFHAPEAKKRLAACLLGPANVLEGQRRVTDRQSVPSVKILTQSGEPLGIVSGHGTLYHALGNGGVSWTDGYTPPNYFNLYGVNTSGHYLLPYKVPLADLPDEVILVAVKTKYKSKQYKLPILTNNGFELYCASPEFQADPEIVLAAVTQCWYALEHASAELRADREFMLCVMEKNGSALEYAFPEYQLDREIVLAAVTQNGNALKFASPELMADREIVLAAVKKDGYALKFASPELMADREIVLAAVKKDGYALEFASPELKEDREIVLAAVTQTGWALIYASAEFQADPKLRENAGM